MSPTIPTVKVALKSISYFQKLFSKVTDFSHSRSLTSPPHTGVLPAFLPNYSSDKQSKTSPSNGAIKAAQP